jgi:hypothetical protein
MIKPIHKIICGKFSLFSSDLIFLKHFLMQNIEYKTLASILFFLFFVITSKSQTIVKKNESSNINLSKKDSPLLKAIISANYDSLLPVSKNTAEYELQIIYTQIDRDKNNDAVFTTHYLGQEHPKYFYPASLVKLPVCALALENLNELKIPELNKESYMFTDSALKCLGSIYKDSTAVSGYPSIANYIKKMLLVSDNSSYSRIYEFLGVDYIHEKLANKNLQNVFILNKFDGFCSADDHKQRLPVVFTNSRFDTLFIQKPYKSVASYKNPRGKVLKGKKQMTNSGRIIAKPKDFSNSNYLSLLDIDCILKRIYFPQNFSKQERFNLTEEDYSFLKKYMGMKPRESVSPKYNDSLYEDSYKKYLIYGNYHQRIEIDSIRIFNIVGLSYGTVADCAYIVNKDLGIEFFLSAVLYVNKNGIMNDGKYEYKQVGFPFLSNLGKAIYGFEYTRKKEKKPDFRELDFDFSSP